MEYILLIFPAPPGLGKSGDPVKREYHYLAINDGTPLLFSRRGR